MSIQKKTIPVPAVPATTREVAESVTCDLCGDVIGNADIENDGIDWENARGYGEVHKTCVQIGKGYTYPDAHNIEFRDYHICPTCFETKLEPWLKAQGAKPTEREEDW